MQPQYPTQPMPQYPQQPPAAPAYPQQFAPPAPAYPVAPAYPQQFPAQGYPQQPYPQPAAPAGPPLPAGTLDGFYEQPSSGGGPSWKFNQKPIGTNYVGIVARTVTNADVRHQTNQAGIPQTYKDGRPKLVMVVPMQVQPSQEFPEGVAGWWVKGQARDELARAMSEAGAPAGPPEAGAAIRVTLVGMRQIPNMNPAYQYRVEYVRPNGAAPAVTPQVAPVQQVANLTGGPAVQATQVPAANFAPVAEVHQMTQPMPQPAPMPVPQQVPAPAPMPQPAPVAQAPQQAAPTGFNAEQAELFAKLTGGQQQAA